MIFIQISRSFNESKEFRAIYLVLSKYSLSLQNDVNRKTCGCFLTIGTVSKIKFGLKGPGGRRGGGESRVFGLSFSGSLSSTEVLAKRGAAGRGLEKRDAWCQVAKCLSTSKARDQRSPPSPAPVPAAPRVSQAAPAKVALVGGTRYFFPNSLSICSLLSEVKGG